MEQNYSKSVEELQEIALKANKEKVNDIKFVDPRLIITEKGHNVRIFEDDRVKQHVEELRDNIRENGLITPLECRKHQKIGKYKDEEGKEYDLWSWIIVDGECRKRAIDLLIEEGCEIKTVPVIPEKPNSNEANRVLDMLNANLGLRFTNIELANAYNKFIKFGWTPTEIAKRVGKSLTHVNDCLSLLGYSETIQKGLKENKITANDVRKVNKSLKGSIENTQNRRSEVEKKLEEAMKKAEESADLGNNIKASKFIKVNKTDSEILAEQLDNVLNALPKREYYTNSELEELFDLLSANHSIKNSINAVFGSKTEEGLTGTEK